MIMKKIFTCCLITEVCLFFAVNAGAEGLSANRDIPQKNLLTIINYADTPVYATAVTVPAKTLYSSIGLNAGIPVEAVTPSGESIPFMPFTENGSEVLRAYLSLKPNERVDLKLQQAKQWGAAGQFTKARYDAATGTAQLGNGVIAFDYRDGKWSLSFAGAQTVRTIKPAGLEILKNCKMDLWVDSELRGRVMGVSPEKVKGMGLIHSQEAKLLGGEAKVNPDGSAELKLNKGFGGFASNVTWTETYTLQSGQPVLIHQNRFSCSGDAKRYLAFVELGGGLRGDYGTLLQGKTRCKYENPKEPSRILLSGNENSYTRLGWRGEICWVGVDSEIGCGVGFSTLKNIKRGLPGSSVWSFGNQGFFVRLIDAEQENFPYEFSGGKPLELGFAYVATCGKAGIWNQTRNLFKTVTEGKPVSVSGSCAVYIGDTPLRAGEVESLALAGDSPPALTGLKTARRAALEIDFQRPYRLAAKADIATSAAPILVRAYPIGNTEKAVTLLTLNQPGEQEADFTALTKWQGKRQTFVLEVNQSGNSSLKSLRLEASGFPAPELDSPNDGISLTDLAVFFRWKQVKGALDYELQLAQDEKFGKPVTLLVRSEVDWPYYMPTDSELPKPGSWFWRVRAIESGRPGAWSSVRRFTVNNDHAKKPVNFVISPERPLFTIEACRVADLGKFKNTIPEDIKPYIGFNCHTKSDFIKYLKPLQEAGQTAFVRTHGPGPMLYWMPLADVEEVFQTYSNIIGITGGETLSTHYHGGQMQTYINRLLRICGKYGRIFYDADGTYPGENKWQELYAKEGALMKEYSDHLIFAQKNNILHRQFVSQSSVLGLYLTDGILAQGAWEDGGWYWQQVGFRKLGDIRGQRGGDPCDMPRNFWNLTFLMGVARGCTVFSFEGQTGTMPVPAGYLISEKGLPKNSNPMAHWTTQGELTPAFHRFMAPFIRGVIQHKLVPTKAQVLDNIRIGVYNDGIPKKTDGDQYYYEWEALCRGTYGFRDVGVIPGTLMEFFPNTGRYNYFPVFPQGKVDLKGVETVPLSQLMEPAAVKARFDKAYPEWYSGNALVTIVGDTLAFMNSNENTDITENYSVPLKNRGSFANIAGKIATHSYLMGKFEEGNKSLWLQANAEYPERDTELILTCKGQPQVKVTPGAAAKTNQWDATAGTLTLRLSHTDGAVEVEIKF